MLSSPVLSPMYPSVVHDILTYLHYSPSLMLSPLQDYPTRFGAVVRFTLEVTHIVKRCCSILPRDSPRSLFLFGVVSLYIRGAFLKSLKIEIYLYISNIATYSLLSNQHLGNCWYEYICCNPLQKHWQSEPQAYYDGGSTFVLVQLRFSGCGNIPYLSGKVNKSLGSLNICNIYNLYQLKLILHISLAYVIRWRQISWDSGENVSTPRNIL